MYRTVEVKLKEGRRELALIFINYGASIRTTECLLKGLSVWYPLLRDLSFLPSHRAWTSGCLRAFFSGLWKRWCKVKPFLLKPIFYSLSKFLPPSPTTYCMEWVWCWDDPAGPLFAASGKEIGGALSIYLDCPRVNCLLLVMRHKVKFQTNHRNIIPHPPPVRYSWRTKLSKDVGLPRSWSTRIRWSVLPQSLSILKVQIWRKSEPQKTTNGNES